MYCIWKYLIYIHDVCNASDFSRKVYLLISMLRRSSFPREERKTCKREVLKQGNRYSRRAPKTWSILAEADHWSASANILGLRPRQTKEDQGKPRQAKVDQNRPRQTKTDQGRPMQGDAGGCSGDAGQSQAKPSVAKPGAAKADYGRPRQTKQLWYPRCYHHLRCIFRCVSISSSYAGELVTHSRLYGHLQLHCIALVGGWGVGELGNWGIGIWLSHPIRHPICQRFYS